MNISNAALTMGKDNIGKVSTVKLSSGLEIICTVKAIADDGSFITMNKPKIIVISVDKTAAVPYQYTSADDDVTIDGFQVTSISKSSEQSAEDYLNLVNNTEEKENS